MTVTAPPWISAYAEGSFARFTVDKRLPKIQNDAIAQCDSAARSDPRWRALADAIAHGDVIDTSLFAVETPYWGQRLAQVKGARWRDLGFFDLEFFFYLALRSIAGDVAPGLDVFRVARDHALTEALPRVARVVESSAVLGVEAALLLALHGNEADLSQLSSRRAESAKQTLLVDEGRAVIDRLTQVAGSGCVQLLGDNAGSELCYDLILADALLRNHPVRVELQLKPVAMFVSDALVADAEQTIERFCKFSADSAISQVGERLQLAVGRGDLRLLAPTDWAEPRHMNSLDAELTHSLRSASVVVAKGDLHYRRFFEDRAWSASTPVWAASVVDDMYAIALRVLKSDCVVGIDAALAHQLSNDDSAWRSNGRYAVMQRVDRRA